MKKMVKKMTARMLTPSECDSDTALVVVQVIYDDYGYDWAYVAAETYNVPLYWFIDESDLVKGIE